MKIIKLQSHLKAALANATEVKIAVAIMSDNGLDFVLKGIQDDCTVKLLIGIDLPTPNTVFENLLRITNSNIQAKVFTKSGFFHPKFYLIKGDSNIAFIGSGNCTDGGLGNHIELFHKCTVDDILIDYEKWFDQYFTLGTAIEEDWLKAYKLLYNERAEAEANDKRKLGDFKKRFSPNKKIIDLNSIDFSNQFFKLHHHLAFEGNKPQNRTPEINSERYEVKEKLMVLHEILYSLIKGNGWDLHHHSMAQHIVSSFKHGEHTSEALDALWLHYGRSQPELDRFKKEYGDNQTNLYHMRCQVLIHLESVSVWLTVGKNNGGVVDRNKFKERMKEDVYRNTFFNLVNSLPDDFEISINGEWEYVKKFKDAIELHAHVKKDDITHHYFIIGREYTPDAPEISEKNISKTVMSDFEKLYPIYKHVKTTI